MKTKRNSKEYSLEHVQTRAKERYQLDFSEKDYKELCDRAKRFLIKSSENGVSKLSEEKNGDDTQIVLSIYFKETKIIAVYSKNRDRITTLLPPNKT